MTSSITIGGWGGNSYWGSMSNGCSNDLGNWCGCSVSSWSNTFNDSIESVNIISNVFNDTDSTVGFSNGVGSLYDISITVF